MTTVPQPSAAARQVNPTEVGWQFVPQYYTFVNKQPNRLHCFYTKNSTFSHGTEGEDTKACFGQQEIHSKIMALNYENCKVFIHSVDAQSSANSGILIQVVGEMSNRDEPWKKFVQTFFLAEQPNGYFVLNDIFRFLKEESADEGEEEEEQEAAAEEEEEPAPVQTSVEQSQEPAAPVPVSVSVPVDQVSSFKPEEPVQPSSSSPAPPATVEAVSAPEPTPSQSTEAPYVNGVNGHSETVESEDTHEAEPTSAPHAEAEPVTTIPEPTPAPEVPPPVKVPSPAPPPTAVPPSSETPQKSPAPTPAPPPPAPSGPKTWATLAASNNKKWGSVASDAKGVSAAAPQTPPPAPSPRPTPNGTRAQEQSSSQAITTAACFVKGVTENVSEQAMRDLLTARFGAIKELEIVRSKACAFLEFTTVEAARKAIQASLPPHAGGEGGIRLEAKGSTGAPPRLTIERRKERDERPPPRPRGGAPSFGEGRGAIGVQAGEGRGGAQGGRGRGATRGRGGAPKS